MKAMCSKITQLVLDARDLIRSGHVSPEIRDKFDEVFVDYLTTAYRDLRQVRSVQDILNRNYINAICHLLSLA